MCAVIKLWIAPQLSRIGAPSWVRSSRASVKNALEFKEEEVDRDCINSVPPNMFISLKSNLT